MLMTLFPGPDVLVGARLLDFRQEWVCRGAEAWVQQVVTVGYWLPFQRLPLLDLHPRAFPAGIFSLCSAAGGGLCTGGEMCSRGG